MSALQQSGEHRATALVRRLREELTSVAGAPLWSHGKVRFSRRT